MTRLEDLRPHAAVRGILPDAQVSVVTTQWFGSDALELTYKDPVGRVGNVLLYRHDEPRLEVVEQGRPWSFDGDRKAPSRRLQALPRQRTAGMRRVLGTTPAASPRRSSRISRAWAAPTCASRLRSMRVCRMVYRTTSCVSSPKTAGR